MTERLIEKLGELGGTLTTSYEQNKPVNAAGAYKDMINQLSAVNQSIKDKPVPVWNWPQYASVGVRNSSFANVDPATEQSQDFGNGYCAQKITLVVLTATGPLRSRTVVPSWVKAAAARPRSSPTSRVCIHAPTTSGAWKSRCCSPKFPPARP